MFDLVTLCRCLQDYLVLLPSAYYEAPILQIHVTEPCTYSSAPEASNKYSLPSYTQIHL